MSENGEIKTQKGLPRRFKALLFVSLALNLLVVGLVAGSIWRFGSDGSRHFHGDPVIRALSHEDRRAVGRAVREAQGGERRALRRALGDTMEEMISTLEAEPFDASALDAIMARKSTLLQRRRAVGEAAIADTIARMSPEERHTFTQRLRRGYESWQGKEKRRVE